jgi:photosystem II stability/assembly factor-like uncharacterized protein
MKHYKLLLVLTLFLASAASAQIAPPPERTPQEGEQGWVQVPTGSTTAGYGWISITPSGKLWVFSQEHILTSTNFGESWDTPNLPVNGFADFYNDSIGFLAGDPRVFKTTDGGRSWIEGAHPELNFVSNMCYADSSTIFCTGASGISKSSDGGLSWFRRQVTASNLQDVHFPSHAIGYVTGMKNGSEFGTLFRTSDAGERWNRLTTVPALNYGSVFALGSDTILLAGLAGYIIRSTNGGQTWDTTARTDALRGIGNITFTNAKDGFAVGGYGVVLRTEDGGASWITQNSTVTSDLYAIEFYNDSVLFAGGVSGTLIKTTNAGKSWVQILPQRPNIKVALSVIRDRAQVRIAYQLSRPDEVTVSVYSTEGRLMTELLRRQIQQAQSHELQLDVSSYPSGLYHVRLTGEHHHGTSQFTVIR